MQPDDELLGVVVHSGLVLGRSKHVVAALRRITAFPTGLALDTVVLARDVHAQAAGRRAQAATAHRRAAATAQREDEAAAEHDSETAVQREGSAAAERHHVLQQAANLRRLNVRRRLPGSAWATSAPATPRRAAPPTAPGGQPPTPGLG